MCRALALILFAAPALAVAQPPPDAVKAELAKLVGTWEGYAVEGAGERPDRGPFHLRITITETKMSAIDLGNGNKDMGSGTFRLDPSQPLKELDATGVVFPMKKERTYRGIYRLDGDTLKWCVDNRQKDRPAEFRTTGGNYLLVLKRKK